MNRDEILNSIIEIINKSSFNENRSISPANNVKDYLEDSMDFIELIMNIEEKFNIEISDSEIDKVNLTINDLVSIVSKYVNSGE